VRPQLLQLLVAALPLYRVLRHPVQLPRWQVRDHHWIRSSGEIEQRLQVRPQRVPAGAVHALLLHDVREVWRHTPVDAKGIEHVVERDAIAPALEQDRTRRHDGGVEQQAHGLDAVTEAATRAELRRVTPSRHEQSQRPTTRDDVAVQRRVRRQQLLHRRRRRCRASAV
jgi:hypothetical protein